MFDREREITELLLRTGGDVLMASRGRSLDVTAKRSSSDIVTPADVSSERAMLAALQREAPDDGVLCEESGFRAAESGEDVWVLDPLDGTVNYVTGLNEFGVIVGLTRRGSPIVGGMYLPVTGDLYFAARGCGALHNGVRISVSATERVEDAVFDHSLSNLETVLAAQDLTLQALVRRARGVRCIQSLTYLARVAEGIYDGLVYHSLGLWDICGPSVILEEAGAEVVDLTGAPLDLAPGPWATNRVYAAAAANPVLLEQLLSVIKLPD
ncbi:MAG TPA: inositol monophosphatase [Acidimicrobiales bacterium]|nr:inositol monophosphatase [Acidimicrobiales bacterium]